MRVFEHGTKIEVETTDLSSGATLQQSFQKDKVHSVQLRQGSGNDVFENEVHDRHIHTQTFSATGLEIGDDHGGLTGHGADDASGHR